MLARLIDARDGGALVDTDVEISDFQSGRRTWGRTDSAGAFALSSGRLTIKSADEPPHFDPVDVTVGEDIGDIAVNCIGYLRVELTGDGGTVPMNCSLAIVPERELELDNPLPAGDVILERNAAAALRTMELTPWVDRELSVPVGTEVAYVLLAWHPDLHRVSPGHPAWVGTVTRMPNGAIRSLPSLSSPAACPVSAPFELQPGEIHTVEIALASLVPARFYLDVDRSSDWTAWISWQERSTIGAQGNGHVWKSVERTTGRLPADLTYLEARVRPGPLRFDGVMSTDNQVRLLHWRGEVDVEGRSISSRDALGPWRISASIELRDGESIDQWTVHEDPEHGGNGYFVIRNFNSTRVDLIGLRGPVGTIKVEATSPKGGRTLTATFDAGEQSFVRLR